ncbi:MAG: DUF4367 domain-containing protein [Peptococcaceae bacterium]|nr:DUF4367 domain-containing protein [Peptococcaceae bacterium]
MQLNDDILCRAAALVRDKRMNSLSEYEEYPVHEFSEAFETEMQGIMDKLGKGEITPYKVFMGWQYYARHGLVAVLVCILLTCFAAPQAVMAGYQKLIEVIETVVTEYTEYRYQVNATVSNEFQQVMFGYLPGGMELTEELIQDRSYYVEYRKDKKFFRLEQILLTDEDGLGHIVDTENATVEQHMIKGTEVKFISKRGINGYVWVYGKYLITGQSNCSVEEMIKILESIQYDAFHYNAEHQMNKVLFGYLPEGMELTEESLNETLYYVLYQGKNQYFCLEQRLLLEDTELTQIIDTEEAYVEQKRIQNEMAILSLKDGVYTYTWIYENYQISGISNLSGEEVIKILESIQ